jgi:hypothetical protein
MNEYPIHQARISAEYASKRNQAAHTIVQPPSPKRTEKKNSSAPNQASIINACLACMPPILKTKNANAASLPIQGQRNIPSQCIHAVLKTSTSSVRELLVLSVLSLCTTAFYEPYPPFVLPPAIIHIRVCANSSCPHFVRFKQRPSSAVKK